MRTPIRSRLTHPRRNKSGGDYGAIFRSSERKIVLIRAALLTALAALFVATPAFAETAGAGGAWFNLTTNAKPSVLPRGGQATLLVTAENLGDANASTCSRVAAATGRYTSAECNEEASPPGSGEYEKTPIVLTVTLPEGLETQKIEPELGKPEPKVSFNAGSVQGGLGGLEEGRFTGSGLGPGEAYAFLESCSEPAPRQVRCVYPAEPYLPTVVPYGFAELGIAVKVGAGAVSGAQSTALLSGGDAPSVQAKRSLPVGEAGAGVPFGAEEDGLSVVPEEAGGTIDAQAGSHPFQLTTSFALNQTANALKPPALPRDLTFELPPGLVANAVAFPRCTELQFLTKAYGGFADECPQDTAVGVVLLSIDEPVFGGVQTYPIPVFNLTPKQGEPVRFGFYFIGAPVPIDFHVRTGEDYGASATVSNVTQITNFLSESLTIWGVPGEAIHNASRGWGCIAGEFYSHGGHLPCTPETQIQPPPFLTLPTSCTEPFAASVEGESWPAKAYPAGARFPAPGEAAPRYALKDEFERAIGISGCDRLAFDPFIEVAPDVQDASTSTGLKVDVKVPQEVSKNAQGLASSSVKDITVALPAGVQVNPSGANGLEACSEGLVGFEAGRGAGGFEEFESEPGVKNPLFTPRLPGSTAALEAGEEEELKPGVNFCATAAKIGTAKIKSPLIMQPLEGAVYLASQNQNPFGSLIAAYIVAEDVEAGVLVKLPGEVSLCKNAGEELPAREGVTKERCGAPGQLVSAFENEPQLPFEDAELHFFGGERAPLATPAHCGTYTTDATFTPWSGTRPVTATSAFQVDSGPKTAAQPNGGPGGGECPSSQLPFSPSATGGATNVNAGAFSPFTATFSRQDGEQNMQSFTVKLPPGLSGMLSNVELCPEPQANEGECGPNSLIGESTVSVGVGGDPFSVSGGKLYLTGPYNGTGGCTTGTPGCAPFGLTFTVPAKAGPFDLERNSANPAGEDACDCIIVRGKVEINPITAALTITTNPAGSPDAIPTMIEGIPLEIQHANAITNRSDFQFNPTNCDKMEIAGTAQSSEGATDTIHVPFKVTNCAALKFDPKISFSTNGHTSKQDGADLITKVSYPNGPQGTYANVAKVKVELPKALPSRLTTLQRACTAKVFEANPAACPAESKIGYAIVHTPLLPVPLVGPAIFVSHGGEAFPSLTMVLQGYGVTIDLVGTTFISKKGITSTTFKTVPDQPFSTFELTLPQGKFSALAANVPAKDHGSLCGQKLTIPNEFFSQAGGAPLRQDSRVTVTGCKTLTRAQKFKAALKMCRRQDKGLKNRARRERCEKAARRRYSPIKKKKRR
jgi:hypothetical protein